MFKFFTVQSNVLAGVVAIVYIIYLITQNKTKKQMPLFVYILKFIVTIDLIITFLVVALFLGFIVEEGYFSLYTNANLFFHFLIPVLNFISFIAFENKRPLKIWHTFIGILHVVLYSIFYLTVVFLHLENGAVDIKYDWYAFTQRGPLGAFICAVVILGFSYLLSFALYKFSTKKIK